MKPLFAIAVGVALLGLAARVSADDKKKDEKKEDVVAKLLGSWEVTKADQDGLVDGTITFLKEGKYTFEKDGRTSEGTYKIDENGKLITTAKQADGEEASDSDTIEKLTADVMELKSKDGKATSLKKKK